MDKLLEEIRLEKNIIDRCKKSIERNEPYDLCSMRHQIDISQKRIVTIKMKLYHSKNTDETPYPRQPNITEQIVKTQLLCDGANKVHRSIISEENKNPRALQETEQIILELNEKLELLLRCAQTIDASDGRSVGRFSTNLQRCNDSSTFKTNHVQVSGLLKIRITGLTGLPTNTSYKKGKYASEWLRQKMKRKKGMFSRYGSIRSREPLDDYIVVIHVGGKAVATTVWNEKKTMYCADEESIDLRKSRQIDFEIYHTDGRSLCAIGTLQLDQLLEKQDGLVNRVSSTYQHQTVILIPDGKLFCQTAYSNPEQTMERKMEQDERWKNTLTFRKSGTVLARNTRKVNNTRVKLNQSYIYHPISQRETETSNDYIMMNVIGLGAFGTVKLAKKIDNNQYFAIKQIEKNPKTGKYDTPELTILKSISHPNICNLVSSFVEQDSLFLVLDFCEAGDIHTHLSKTAHGFSKSQITFFAASIVLAVEYLHNELYVHRDLKLENMMLTRCGTLKLIDFGLCKQLKSRKEKMVDILGTPSHLSAEMWRGEPYGIETDWWAVGVSLYQLRTRADPYQGTREADMERNSRVNKWHTFHDLLIGLMSKHPEARLGYYGTKDVKDHPFFMDICFDDIHTMTPPYVPLLRSNIDLEYFDSSGLRERQSNSSISSCNSSQSELLK